MSGEDAAVSPTGQRSVLLQSGLPAVARAALVTVLLGSLLVITAVRRPGQLEHAFASPERVDTSVAEQPVYTEERVTHRPSGFVHSATLAEIGEGGLRAFWMGGTREGHRDVALYSSVFNPESGTWSADVEVMTVDRLKRLLHRNIITLGNPVAMAHEDGRLFLWFVSVSIGGWSGSAINLMISHDGGESWDRPQRLITTPAFNVSTLVKCLPFRFADGTIGLPVYHECFGKFGELLRLDERGRLVDKQRLTWGRSSLQPDVTVLSESHAVVFMRRAGDAPRRVLMIETGNGGESWTDPVPLDMPNPSSPVAAVLLETGEKLICFNNQEHKRGRKSLAVSSDGGRTYEVIAELDDRDKSGEHGVSYPTLMRTSDGMIHLVYTQHRVNIKHVSFNQAWIDEAMADLKLRDSE